METPISTVEENAETRPYSGTTVFLAIVATLVLLAVAEHWNGFGLFDKFIAMLLVFNLVVGPPLGKRLVKRPKKGEHG